MSKDKETNFFDELESGFNPAEAQRQKEENEAQANKIDYLIHQTFEQSEGGKKLLGIWKEALIMQPTVEGGLDNLEIGIREGYKKFIRGIILTVNKVEKGE